jgi:hypothetical protein
MSARSSDLQRHAPVQPERGLDLLRARVAFRDRSFADVLDLALRFIVVQGRTYARVALVALVPVIAVSIAAGYAFGWPLSWAISVPLAIVAEIPFTVLASRLVFQDHVRARDVIGAAVRDAPRVLLGRVLSLALVAIGLLFVVVPGFWLATTFFFLAEVMLLERDRLFRAFGRSQRLAGSASAEVVLALLVLGLIPPASVLLVDIAGRNVLGEVLQFRPPRPVWATGGSVLATLGLFLQVPYFATARFFLYLNVRTRAEGWDVQTRFAAIAARALEDDAARSSEAA